jgi:positive regulator of sigma E activity
MHAELPNFARQTDCQLTADAIVIAARADGTVDLEFAAFKGCSGCAGTCLWKRLTATRLRALAVDRSLAPGTAVSVALPELAVLRGALVSYGLPLASILIGAAAGAAVAGSDFGTLLGALVALALVIAGFGPIRLRLERFMLKSLVVRPKT